jgi:hypothetical protein
MGPISKPSNCDLEFLTKSIILLSSEHPESMTAQIKAAEITDNRGKAGMVDLSIKEKMF